MHYASLIQPQREELTHLSHQAVGRVAVCAQMVLLSNWGFSMPLIAAIYECSEDIVRTWLQSYEQRDMARPPAQPRELAPTQEPPWPVGSWNTQASQSPPYLGHVQTCWSVALLTAFLARSFRLILSPTRVRRWLHRMGWRRARPRLAFARKHEPQAESKLAASAAA